MVQKLCLRSLQRGVGSMDYIHGLLIMEDDLKDKLLNNSDITSTPGTSTEEQLTSVEGTPGPAPPAGSTTIPWCKCGICQIMPQDIENKCCSQRRCVTVHSRFSKLCLDPDVLQLAIRNRGNIRNDRDDNSTRAFRKAAYRQFVLDRYGFLGKGNRTENETISQMKEVKKNKVEAIPQMKGVKKSQVHLQAKTQNETNAQITDGASKAPSCTVQHCSDQA
ncbi:hypothetical protein ACROYT_G021885 [Oculina patagonica]